MLKEQCFLSMCHTYNYFNWLCIDIDDIYAQEVEFASYITKFGCLTLCFNLGIQIGIACCYFTDCCIVSCQYAIAMIYSINSHIDENIDMNTLYIDNPSIEWMHCNLTSLFPLIVTTVYCFFTDCQ